MTTRTCNICGVTKPLDQFYKDAHQTGGHAYRCKDCDKQKAVKWQRESGYNNSPERRLPGNPNRQAKQAVASAVKRGAMPKASTLACRDCGGNAKEYHHESYTPDKWYDVVALCVPCHRRRHGR